MRQVRDIAVSIVIETNKDTVTECLRWEEDETVNQLIARVESRLRAMWEEGNE